MVKALPPTLPRAVGRCRRWYCKLAPWRWLEIADRDAFAALLQRAHRAAQGRTAEGEDRAAIDRFACSAPCALALIASPQAPLPLRAQAELIRLALQQA